MLETSIKLVQYLFLVCGVLLLSCEDNRAPEIQIITPHAGSTLKRDVTIEVAVSDNYDLLRIEILIDGEVFAEMAGSPYRTTWNTREYENGPHMLQCKAIDTNGNETLSAGIEVTVANSLVSAIFSNNWICTACDRGVIFVTGKDGTLLGQASWTGNDTVRIQATHTTRPDTANIDVTTIRHDGLGNILVTTYLDVHGGDRLMYKGLPRVFLNDYEYMQFSFTNIPSHAGWSVSNGFADSWAYPDQIHASVNLRNFRDQVSVYLQLANTSGGTRYLWLENQDSGPVTLDLANLSQASSQVIQFPPGGDQARSILTGYRTAQSYYDAAYLLDRQRIFNFSDNTMTVHPPPALMADYKTYMYYFEAGGWIYNTVFGPIPEAFNKLQAELNIASGDKEDFVISTSGNFDQIRSLWRHTISTGTVDWNVYGPPDRPIYALPMLPSLAAEIFPQVQRDQVILILTDLIDYTELDSYEAVLNTRFQTAGYFNEYVRESRTRSKNYTTTR